MNEWRRDPAGDGYYWVADLDFEEIDLVQVYTIRAERLIFRFASNKFDQGEDTYWWFGPIEPPGPQVDLL
jgi:hypothetical protein